MSTAPSSDEVQRLTPPADGAFAAELAQATERFNSGDFRGVRERCQAVLAGREGASPTEAERAFAADLLQRTGIDRAAIIVGAVTAAVIALLVLVTAC